MKYIRKQLILPILLIGLLAGCAAPKDTSLYEWSGYSNSVYETLQGSTDPEKQIIEIEKNIAESQSKGRKVAPGLYAHLGMLYDQTGNTARAKELFFEEKNLYPESSQFMDFLLKNKEKK